MINAAPTLILEILLHQECKEDKGRTRDHPNDGMFIPMRTNNCLVGDGPARLPAAPRASKRRSFAKSKLK